MSRSEFKARFQSPVAALMEQFVREKQACGYRYDEEARILARFDRFLCDEALSQCELPRAITRKWLAKQSLESAATHRCRIYAVRQFATYLCRRGYAADVPNRSLTAKRGAGFSPRVPTHAEVQQLLHAVDQLTPTARSPLRHLIMPEIFRLLYGCGFRVNEVLHLRVSDVDLNRGVLTVRKGKFGKDRLVPPALSLVQRLRNYAHSMGDRSTDAYFFPSPSGGPWSLEAVYRLYRQLLLRCGIAHAGRGKGPRVHDLRHNSRTRIIPHTDLRGLKSPRENTRLTPPPMRNNQRLFKKASRRSSGRKRGARTSMVAALANACSLSCMSAWK